MNNGLHLPNIYIKVVQVPPTCYCTGNRSAVIAMEKAALFLACIYFSLFIRSSVASEYNCEMIIMCLSSIIV